MIHMIQDERNLFLNTYFIYVSVVTQALVQHISVKQNCIA